MSVTPGGTTGGPEATAPAHAVPALLVMHAGLAEALLRAAEKVYGGSIEGVRVLSNDGLSRFALEETIGDAVQAWKSGGLVLTDFWGGSCHTCGLAAARGRGEVIVITGVNLPLLLDYLHNRDKLGAAELAERLEQKGRDSIRLQRGQSA